MKTRVLRTDVPRPREMIAKRIWLTVGGPRGISFQTKTVLISTPPSLAEMLTETEDGTSEVDVRDAIAAAALADDWLLSESIAKQYGLVVCLRCATDMQYRPGWRVHRLIKREDIRNCWGEVCGSCAVEILELQG